MLGGGTANIRIVADHSRVVLQGWVMDAAIHDLAVKLASRTAGRRSVSTQVTVENCRSLCKVSRRRSRVSDLR
jgi:osmotically-inducible protein OsmY